VYSTAGAGSGSEQVEEGGERVGSYRASCELVPGPD